MKETQGPYEEHVDTTAYPEAGGDRQGPPMGDGCVGRKSSAGGFDAYHRESRLETAAVD